MTIEITSKTVCNIITVKDRRKLEAKLNKREVKSYVKGFQKKVNADSEQTCKTGLYQSQRNANGMEAYQGSCSKHKGCRNSMPTIS